MGATPPSDLAVVAVFARLVTFAAAVAFPALADLVAVVELVVLAALVDLADLAVVAVLAALAAGRGLFADVVLFDVAAPVTAPRVAFAGRARGAGSTIEADGDPDRIARPL